MSESWSLNVPESHADEFPTALDQAVASPPDAPTAAVAAAKSSIKILFDALVSEEGGGDKSYKANAAGHSVPHSTIDVACADAAASWN